MATFTLENLPNSAAIEKYRQQVAAGAAKLLDDLVNISCTLPDSERSKITNVINLIRAIRENKADIKLRLTARRTRKHLTKTIIKANGLSSGVEAGSVEKLLKNALKQLSPLSKHSGIQQAYFLIKNAQSNHELLREEKSADFLYDVRNASAEKLLKIISKAIGKDHDRKVQLHRHIYRLSKKNRFNLNTTDRINDYIDDVRKVEKDMLDLFGLEDSSIVHSIKQFSTTAIGWSDHYQQDAFTSNFYLGGKIRLSDNVLSHDQIKSYKDSAYDILEDIRNELESIRDKEFKGKGISAKVSAYIDHAIKNFQLEKHDCKLRPSWFRVGSTDLVANGLCEAHGSDPVEHAILDAIVGLPRRVFDPHVKAMRKMLHKYLGEHETLRRDKSNAFLFDAKRFSADKISRNLALLENKNIDVPSDLKTRLVAIRNATERSVDTRDKALSIHRNIVDISRDVIDFFNENDDDNTESAIISVVEFSTLSKRWIDPYYHNPIITTVADKARDLTGTLTTIVGTVCTVLGFVALFVPVFGPLASVFFFSLSFVSLYSVADRLFEMGRNIWHGRSVTVEQVKQMGFTAFISVGIGMAIGQVLAQIGIFISTHGSIAAHRAGSALAKGAASFVSAVKMCYFSVQAIFETAFQGRKKKESPQIDPLVGPEAARVNVPEKAIFATVSQKKQANRIRRVSPSPVLKRKKSKYKNRYGTFLVSRPHKKQWLQRRLDLIRKSRDTKQEALVAESAKSLIKA